MNTVTVYRTHNPYRQTFHNVERIDSLGPARTPVRGDRHWDTRLVLYIGGGRPHIVRFKGWELRSYKVEANSLSEAVAKAAQVAELEGLDIHRTLIHGNAREGRVVHGRAERVA